MFLLKCPFFLSLLPLNEIQGIVLRGTKAEVILIFNVNLHNHMGSFTKF